MTDTIKDLFIVLGRIVTILPLMLMLTLYMGKRAIGELPVFDFLIILTLGAVVGADIADPSIDHLPTAFAIVIIAILQRLVASWKIANRKFGRLLTFEPMVVVKDGKFLHANLKKSRYSIDNILQMLRLKDVFDLNDVELAIIEANGSLSVYKKEAKQTVTIEDMGIAKKSTSLAFPVVVEGKLYSDVLQQFNVDDQWLHQQLSSLGIDNINDVFYASINNKLELHLTRKQEQIQNIPIVHH
ncbi:DUF421 domain-containing protein [Aquibacillus albus]|uniref:Uncharacterized membrane protein YcaP (DUF421 family) n=1 Tax=Aquibacillus albus TaxID=1168171 RepID=A0ABS2N386_9BACI|nr:DUF421 domain-containing protein [Aquibacillus albus]MBM7572604.1 uncharacterized membrane protein YcaP (DUF421 family) [Aquibacillus albus]